MANSVDKILFEDLAGEKPEDVCRRALCEYDKEKKCYTISVWGDEYAIYPHEYKIDRLSNKSKMPHKYLYVFMINYLLNAKNIEVYDKWISEKDIPGGTTFFRGPHAIPINLISDRFGDNIDDFKKCCENLDGVPLDMADAAYVFKITPRIPVAVLYWAGDDDFPADSKLLYDKSITEHLASDIVFALAIDICARVGIKN